MGFRLASLVCLAAFCSASAHAQIVMPPGFGGLMQVPPGMPARGAAPAIDCKQLESMQGSQAVPGIDMRGLLVALGCKPPQSAQQAKLEPKPVQVRHCASFRAVFADLEGENTDWLGPQPVLLARFLAERCGGAPANSFEQRLITGFLRFVDGRFAESAQVFNEAAAASSGIARTRAVVESGKSLLANGRPDEAKAIFTAAVVHVSPKSPLRGELVTLLGMIELAAGNDAAALQRLLEADKLAHAGVDKLDADFFDPTRHRHAPYLAAALHRSGRTADARRLLERVVTGREQIASMSDQAQHTMPMMQEMLQSSGLAGLIDVRQLTASRGFESFGITMGEALSVNIACAALESIELDGNRAEQALEVVERCRGRALARVLANRAFHRPAGMRMPSHAEIEAYAKRHRVEYGDAGQALIKERAGTARIDAASRPATVPDMRRMAAERRATLVVYSIAYAANRLPNRMPDRETGVTIWVISPEGVVTARRRSFEGVLPDSTLALTSAAIRAHEALGVPGRGVANAPTRDEMRAQRTAATLRQFHRLLVEPVEDLLPTAEGARLIVVPQGPLFLVPFAALENSQGAPLVSRYSISVTPSLQTLALTGARRQATRAAGPAVIVGNPLMPRIPADATAPLAPLPGAEHEANAIASLLKSTALTGATATKSAVMSRVRDARYVHFATHGFLDDAGDVPAQGVNPHLREMTMLDERPGGGMKTPGMLALAPGGGDDGVLTADEIAQASTGAELVVMSACGSGQGAINDDGVIGLSRAWMAAGAPSVVVSLWAIPDEPTRDLMVAFYTALAEGSGKSEALRTAMLATRAKHPNPVNWAAFVLLGEPD